MLKVYSKKVISIIVASSLVFGLGNAFALAAPKNDTKDTGRTEQNVQTGVISADTINIPRYAKEIQLTGTVNIDGPQLVVTVPNAKTINVIKLGNKSWKYEATVDVSAMKGDQAFEISAHTIYANGQHAGSTHTSAPRITQKIHVPYITSTVAENTKWTSYERSTNEFTLSYDEVQNWSVGDPVSTPKLLGANGLASEVTVLDKTIKVPMGIQDFTYSQEEPVWEFDANTNTYSASFNILIKDSKDQIGTESVTKTGLTPGQVNTISHEVSDKWGTITKTHELTAPAAPVVQVVSVALRDLQLTPKSQGPNQFKVYAGYTVVYSDGSTETVMDEILEGNFSNPTTQNQNSSTRVSKIGGFDYVVTVTYDSSTNAYYATAILKN